MKKTIKLFFLVAVSVITFTKANAEADLCPLCTMDGKITCPAGYKVVCVNETNSDGEPKCIFLSDKFIPGCWKFIGIKKLDFRFNNSNIISKNMKVEIIGGGETYTLNRETISCIKTNN